MKVLVTGGAGYIGSTICSSLIDNGHIPIILDSLVTGKKKFVENRIFYNGDISDRVILKTIKKDHPEIDYVIHCAALIVVPDSVKDPNLYYRENVSKSLELFYNLKLLGIKNIIFSSSASVYDDTNDFIVKEDSLLNPRSPYARTKFMMEMILEDFCNSYKMRGIALRYFNPIGADMKMRTGPHIKNPSHVLGKMLSTAKNKDEVFKITGVNWPTRDGSGIRDYIHVWDLARAHTIAVEKFDEIFSNDLYYQIINLGTSNGVTVKELVSAFENVIGKNIDKVETEKRLGDVAGAYANNELAYKKLNWFPEKTIEEGIKDSLLWEEIKNDII
ncbi:MAG: UDP-glucose 4-epimerase GalE [Clostridiales bacterium]